MTRYAAIVLLVLFGCSASIFADELPIDADYSWRTSYFSHDREPTAGPSLGISSLWLRGDMLSDAGMKIHAEGWAAGTMDFQGNGTARGELREGWWKWGNDALDLKIGRQIVVWGRADKINPTNQISAVDRTLMFVTHDEQRLGNLMVKAGIPVTSTGKLDLLWLPEFRSNVPRLASIPGISISNRPDDRFNPAQAALRYDVSGGSMDWSLSYFNGLDRNPDIASRSTSVFEKDYHSIQTVGADVATTVSGYGLRGEAAYTQTQNWAGNQPDGKKSFFQLVAGGDTNITEHFNINVQGIYKRVMDFRSFDTYADPLSQGLALYNALISEQTDRIRAGVTLRLGWHGLNDTLAAELSTLFYPLHNERVIRGMLSYAFTDSVKGLVGFDILDGNDGSTYGYLRQTSLGYVGVQVGY